MKTQTRAFLIVVATALVAGTSQTPAVEYSASLQNVGGASTLNDLGRTIGVGREYAQTPPYDPTGRLERRYFTGEFTYFEDDPIPFEEADYLGWQHPAGFEDFIMTRSSSLNDAGTLLGTLPKPYDPDNRWGAGVLWNSDNTVQVFYGAEGQLWTSDLNSSDIGVGYEYRDFGRPGTGVVRLNAVPVLLNPGGSITEIPPPPEKLGPWGWQGTSVFDSDRDNSGYAVAINDTNQIAVRASGVRIDDSDYGTVFSYIIQNGTVLVDDLPRGISDINNHGEAVGREWPSPTWVYLPQAKYGLPSGVTHLDADKEQTTGGPHINDLGEIVWVAHLGYPPTQEPILYKEGTYHRLNDLVQSSENFEINEIIGINNNGQIMVGEHSTYDDDYPYQGTRILSPSPISIVVDPDDKLKIDQEFTATVVIRHQFDETVTYRFPGAIISADPVEAVEMAESALPQEVTMTNRGEELNFTILCTAKKRGFCDLSTAVEIVRADLSTQTVTAEKEILIDPLKVEITITEKAHQLNSTPESEWGPRAQALNDLRRLQGKTPYGNLVEVEMIITNEGEETVSNLNIPAAREILSHIQSTDLERPGVPLFQIRLYGPNEISVDLTDPDDTTTIPDETLAQGESATFAWLLDAYDANPDPEVDDSTDLEFTPLILGSLRGKNIQRRGEAEFSIIERPLLEWGIRPTDGRTSYPSGQTVRVDGYIENISARDNRPPRKIRVLVYQIYKGNLGGGFMFDPVVAGGKTQKSYACFDLPGEGEGKSLNLSAVFRTMPTVKPSGGTVKYGVRLWTVDEDSEDSQGERVVEASQQAIIKDGWSEEFEVTLSADRNAYTALDECYDLQDAAPEISGLLPFLCGIENGLTIDFTDGVIGMGEFLFQGGEQLLNAGVGIALWEMNTMNKVWKAVLQDEAAKQALINEAYVQYRTFVELGMMTGEAGSKAPLAIGDFSLEAIDSMAEFFFAIEKGKVEDVQFAMGHFLGANPDLVLEPFVVTIMYPRISRALTKLDNDLIDNAIEASIRAEKLRKEVSLDQRIADAVAAGRGPETALLPGDIISDPKLLDIYGVTRKQKEAIQKIAKDNGVIITFRSRNKVAIKLIDDGLAYPKPQSLKNKCVNKIDTEYLGYRDDAFGTLEMVEPSPALLDPSTGRALSADDVTGQPLKDAVEAEMQALNISKTKNPVHYNEVSERMTLRAKEWNKMFFDKKKTVRPDGVIEHKAEVAFEADLQYPPGKERDLVKKVGVDEMRTVTYEPIPGRNPRTWRMKMTGPNGGPPRLITGDIDFMSILDEAGGIIRDSQKRIEVYTQLATLLDMQHGESFTFFLQKARKEYLNDHVLGKEGAEAMVSISGVGNGTPRAAMFVDNLSIIDAPHFFSNNAKYLPRRKPTPQSIVDFFLGRGELKFVRRADPSGEYMLLDGIHITTKPPLDLVNRILPKTWDEYVFDFLGSPSFWGPSVLLRLFDPGDAEATFTKNGDEVLVQGRENDQGDFTPHVWTEGVGWTETTMEEVIARGDPSKLELPPMTLLPEGGTAGGEQVAIVEQSYWETPGVSFSPGDRVVFNPGEDNEEFSTVSALGSLIFPSPLQHAHQPGELIASLGPDLTDRDFDTLTGYQEILLGTNPDEADSDFDGFPDNVELDAGFDPLSAASGTTVQSFSVSGTDDPINISWTGYEGRTYQIQASTTLTGTDWNVVKEVIAGPGLQQSTSFSNPLSIVDYGFFRVRLKPESD